MLIEYLAANAGARWYPFPPISVSGARLIVTKSVNKIPFTADPIIAPPDGAASMHAIVITKNEIKTAENFFRFISILFAQLECPSATDIESFSYACDKKLIGASP